MSIILTRLTHVSAGSFVHPMSPFMHYYNVNLLTFCKHYCIAAIHVTYILAAGFETTTSLRIYYSLYKGGYVTKRIGVSARVSDDVTMYSLPWRRALAVLGVTTFSPMGVN